ncbi:ubiquitin-like small modifier protein 1 [Methanolobus halotolerans]|uniref:Molybdopterin synthase sulfur carrier subunit n=1 Tax=Methanolobus halotolerans TaxID=2052935 RepID=A0A4E0PYA2_9EURY|nr:ubiquitin-like small modifier protein 1 [Methanolobus halotolerans]TGC11114.1 molybdopterin synthase sulfur carrier subunit [Methanolobus halotolerans]
MPEIKVRLFANLREKAGESSVVLSGETVQDILFSLIDLHPSLEGLIFENTNEPELRGYINVFLNGNNIKHMDYLGTHLKDGDEVGIFPPVSGG